MIPIQEWLPPALVGVMFTTMAVAKLYGLCKGILGGADKPVAERICGA